MEVIEGVIADYNERGELTVKAHYPDVGRLIRQRATTCGIFINDGRTISPEQRRKIFAMIAEIAEWAGDLPEMQKQVMKVDFKLKNIEYMDREISFSDCSMTLASDFIDYLVNFILSNGVPMREPLSALSDDVEKYVYACLRWKSCAVCGRRGELHHVDAVGMGRDREEIAHKGMAALCLCRAHHTEAHTMGNATFLDRYHLTPVKLDDALCKVFRVRA